MSTEIDKLKLEELYVRRAYITRSVNEAQSTLRTKPFDAMKLHALFERLVSGNAELSTINEQL